MRAAIVGAGPLRGGRALAARLRRADLVISANGGLRAVRRLGVRPHVALGDFDSASAALLVWARRRGAEIIRHPAEKDQTDAEIALDHALARGAREIEIFGALGGRVDHLLANVGLLLRGARGVRISGRRRRARVRIVDGGVELFLAERRTPLAGRPGDLVSLLPLTRRVSGVHIQGVKYPLRDAVLVEGSSLGVSNEIVARRAWVGVRSGDLLVVCTSRPARRAASRAGV
ncbi:MAG TPA: thiamine diphosphokinase [bacterium]|nr:thiamine diphosphokinase [bacterium]